MKIEEVKIEKTCNEHYFKIELTPDEATALMAIVGCASSKSVMKDTIHWDITTKENVSNLIHELYDQLYNYRAKQ